MSRKTAHKLLQRWLSVRSLFAVVVASTSVTAAQAESGRAYVHIEAWEGIKPQAIENVVKEHARRAGLDGVSPHTLRHTFGKSALDAGVNLVTVAALMGHDSVETTAIYTHPSTSDLERAVERLSSD